MSKNLTGWTKLYDEPAKKAGWSLFDHEGTIMILKIDAAEAGDVQLPSDRAALEVVFRQASHGSVAALLALYLDGKEVYSRGQEEKNHDIPLMLSHVMHID